MTDNQPSDTVLFDALIAAVEEVKGNRYQQIAEGLRCQYENGEEPDFHFIAGALGVTLDQLTDEFSKQIYKRTGELHVAQRPTQ